MITRSTGVHRTTCKTKSGLMDFIAICFKTGDHLTIGKVIVATVACEGVDVPQFAADIGGSFSWVSTLAPCRRVTGAKSFSKDKWYIPSDGHFAVIKTVGVSAFDGPHRNSKIAFPLAHFNCKNIISHYFDAGCEIEDLNMALGITEVEVVVETD